jgi:hypothetical protein
MLHSSFCDRSSTRLLSLSSFIFLSYRFCHDAFCHFFVLSSFAATSQQMNNIIVV